MARAYFLGAGASAADGLPTTGELNYCVAAYLHSSRGENGPLARYYREVYDVGPRETMAACEAWNRFLAHRENRPQAPNPLPDFIETLSILDLTIAEEASLGATRRDGAVCYEGNRHELALVRAELAMATGLGIKDAIYRHPTPCARALIQRLGLRDTVITTNWDTLLDRALTSARREHEGGKWLKATNIAYGGVGERIVNWQGDDIRKRAERLYSLYKLHGSLNWFFCPCCANLYANVEGTWIIDPQKRRPVHDECHCGAGLDNVVVAPSFVKQYRNVHLRSVWKHAQHALQEAREWVFVGYSLPSDDYHIRAMLLRALRARLAHWTKTRGQVVQITVVTDKPNDALEARYRDLFRVASVAIRTRGFAQYLGIRASA